MTIYFMSTPHQTMHQFIKQAPTSISDRLSNDSSNKQTFDMSKGEYEKDLEKVVIKTFDLHR